MGPPRDDSDFHVRESDSGRVPLMAKAIARNLNFQISVWPVIIALSGGAWYLTRTVDKLTFQVEQGVNAMDRLTRTVETQTVQINTAALSQATTNGEIKVLHTRMEKFELDHARMLYKNGGK